MMFTDQLGVKYIIDPNKLSEKERLMEMHHTKMYLDAVFLSDHHMYLTRLANLTLYLKMIILD